MYLRQAAADRQTQAFRPGTRRNHFSHWRLYFAFCAHYNFEPLPASALYLSLFAEFLARSFSAPKSISNAVASLKHLHSTLRLPVCQFDDYRLSLMFRALPLTLRHSPRPAPACTWEQLRRLLQVCNSMGAQGAILGALCLTGFFALTRLSSLVPPNLPFDPSRYPTLADLKPAAGGFLLRVKFAKNAQRSGDWFAVPILPSTDPSCCPVRALRALKHLRPSPPAPDSPLFLWPAGPGLWRPMTAPLARRWLSWALNRAHLEQAALTFHSFRRGGCTLAAERGASFRQLQALGNWRSDAVRGYFSPLPERFRAAAVISGSCQPQH